MSDSEERDIVVNRYTFAESDAPPRDGVVLISFDVETTGGRLAKNAMVELGAVAMYADDDEKMRVLTTFEGIMKIPDSRCWEARCLHEFWDNPENDLAAKKKRINECQTEPEDVMRTFVDWVENDILKALAGDDPRRVRFVTDNAAFDPSWVNLYLDLYANHEPLHTFFTVDGFYRYSPVIDTNGVARGISGCTVDDELAQQLTVDVDGHSGWFSATRTARRLLGIPDSAKSGTVHDHRSVHDAQHILESYQIVMRWNKKRAVSDSMERAVRDPFKLAGDVTIQQQRIINDPSKSDPNCHAYMIVKELAVALADIHAADISRDNINKLDTKGLTHTIDRLVAIQGGLEWEREQLE